MSDTSYTTALGVIGTTITGSGFSVDCKPGTIVAVDSDGTYIPAQAKWSGEVGLNGCGIPALSSYVVGVLISEVVAGTGVILCDGAITDPDIIREMVPDSSEDDTGAYYLSTDNPGTAVKGPANTLEIATYCFVLRRESSSPTRTDKTSGNLIRSVVFRPAAPEYAGHSHHCVELNTGWTNDPSGSFTEFSIDSEAGKLLSLSGSSLELLQNGAQLPRDRWTYDKYGSGSYRLRLNEIVAIEADTFILCGTTPFTAREPVVRGIRYGKTSNGLFKFSGLYGQLEMTFNEAAKERDQFTGNAILDLTDEKMITGPVVQELIAGPGTLITNQGPGSFAISSEAISTSLIDLQVCNLDGVLLGSGDMFTSFVFPQAVTSRLYGTIRIPHFSEGMVSGKIHLFLRGGNSGSNLAVNYRMLVPVNTSEGSAIPTTYSTTKLDTSKYSSNENCGYVITTDSIALESDALLLIQLVGNNPGNSVEVFSVSIKLDVTAEVVE